jgi:hypothetical protein
MQPVRRFARKATLVAVTALLALFAVPTQGNADAAPRERPTRVVLIVLDQLRRDFITRFDMDNVQELIAGGVSYRKAYLGHMASETVVSHNVMTSGMLPKHMGWSDEWYRDADGVLGPVGAHYVTGSMSVDQFDALIRHRRYPKLADYLHEAFPGTTVAAVGEKSYATYTLGGPSADMRITYSGRSFDCDGDGVDNWRGPTGTGVPSYLSEPVCGRFYLDSTRSLTYGTDVTSPAWMYPLEGNRDVPGTDPAHRGGDVWVADAAMKVMENEDWSGLLLTFSGIDKAGHMWGGLNDTPPFPPGADAATHLPTIARVADEQVGRVLDKLEDLGQLDDTLVVLTTDHGQGTATEYYGVDGPGRGNFNWYYGVDSDEDYRMPSPEIQRLVDETGNVATSMQDSAIRTWLVDPSRRERREAADVMATLGGVRASFYRTGDRYRLRWQAPRPEFGRSEWRWYKRHAQEIVDTQAADYGPDVVGLLADGAGYGVAGDHGGAQESVQRIPIVFSGAGVSAGKTPGTKIRSVDILPTVLRELGIPPTRRMDGRGYDVP